MQKLFVIKIGGQIIDEASALEGFLDDFARLDGNKILVHGGGKLASEVSRALGIEPRLVDGRRVTDQETLKVVTMVYGGWINKTIVATLQGRACQALGLSGADGNIIAARRRAVKNGLDFGYVGDIDRVDGAQLARLLAMGISPVLAPLTHDGHGNLLNTNADTIASAVASELAPRFHVSLIYCFDKPGVLASADEATVISPLTRAQYQQLQRDGAVAAGMLPKLDNAFAALAAGVASVVLCHAAYMVQVAKGNHRVGTWLRL